MAVKPRIMFALVLTIAAVNVYFVSKTIPSSIHDNKSTARGIKDTLRRYPAVQRDNWIVVTTIAYPTDDIKFLAKLPGWQLVVVGDTKTPKDWRLPGCIYLSVEYQQSLGLLTTNHVPFKSYARKNIGYLFAISNGAKVIYETDDDNRPLDRLNNFVLKPSLWTLAFDGTELFNPYRYFGQPTLWPRGYPLPAVGGNYSSDFLLDEFETPLIQQGVVNGDPDMDAIFRLTRKQTTSILNVTFDQRAPPVIVPNGVLSPFNSQNTLFLYDALWALLLPVTTTQRVCDIWRGYWAQRLMWEIGGHLGFFPPNAFQKRNAHSYLQDAVEEKDLYYETERLVSFLQNWDCDVSLSFFKCVVKLSTDMTAESFMKHQDVTLVTSWIEDLETIGYREPKRKPFQRFHSILENVFPNQQKSIQRSKVKFHASAQVPPSLYQKKENLKSQKLSDISELCKRSKLSVKLSALQGRMKVYPNILLIIVFNFPFYENIHLLETLYRMNFPNILYCGSSRKDFEKVLGNNETVSFIEIDLFKGYFAHQCLMQAMRMNDKYDGYLYIGDDVLLNTWKLHQQPLNKLWVKHCGILQLSVNTTWYWMHKRVGKEAFQTSIQEIQKHHPKRVVKLFHHLKQVTGLKDGICHCWSDIAYVPKRYKNEVIFYLEHFSKFDVFVELVIPNVFYGIEKKENLHVMPGTYLGYDGKRNHTLKYFNKNDLFLHPVKISHAFANKPGHKFFCETILPLTLN